jgi:hypothetical protein
LELVEHFEDVEEDAATPEVCLSRVVLLKSARWVVRIDLLVVHPLLLGRAQNVVRFVDHFHFAFRLLFVRGRLLEVRVVLSDGFLVGGFDFGRLAAAFDAEGFVVIDVSLLVEHFRDFVGAFFRFFVLRIFLGLLENRRRRPRGRRSSVK